MQIHFLLGVAAHLLRYKGMFMFVVTITIDEFYALSKFVGFFLKVETWL